MTVFYSHQDRLRDRTGGSRARFASLEPRALVRRIASRVGAALRVMHQAIVTAKTRRLQRELLFHGSASDDGSLERHMQDVSGPDRDAADFAQRPLVLGDKWDF
jgi:hypothetical protein